MPTYAPRPVETDRFCTGERLVCDVAGSRAIQFDLDAGRALEVGAHGSTSR